LGEVLRKLTPKQEIFCLEYLKDLNATQACIRAGFKAKNADVVGPELLGKTWVKARIDELMEKRAAKINVSAEFVLNELLLLAKTDLANAYDEKGNLKPIHEIPEETRRAIAGIKVFEEFEGFGRERHKVGETRELKLWSKPDALEMLGRHLKLFTEKVEHSFVEDLDQRLNKALKRNA